MNKMTLVGKGLLVVLSVVVSLIMAGSATAGQKGEWEISTTMEIPGMPFAMPATTMHMCLEERGVPFQGKTDDRCTVDSKSISGDTVNWQVTCEGPEGKQVMTGVSTYTGETMDTRIEMKSSQGTMTIHKTGKRIGTCP